MAQNQDTNNRQKAVLNQRRCEIETAAANVNRSLEDISIIDAGYLFRGYCEDYTTGVGDLFKVLDQLDKQQIADLAHAADANTIDPDLKPILRRMCQLSREMTFSIDPLRLPSDVRNEIENVFRLVVEYVAEQIPCIADEDANSHLTNMARRLFTPIAVA